MTFIGFNSTQTESLIDNKITVPENLIQKYVLLPEESKLSFLVSFLNLFLNEKSIVFVHTID